MDTNIFMPLLSAVAAAVGAIVSWTAFTRKSKKDTEKVGEHKGVLASDIGYIKAGVDDLKRESRETRRDIGDLSTRITRVEESCKQAHNRIDETHTRINELHYKTEK